MKVNKPVLVTTDGSDRSHRILPHAALLAGALKAPLVVLQVPDESEMDGKQARETAEATLSRLGLEGEVVIEEREEHEKTADALLRVAGRLDAAVLAIDSRGHGSLRHAIYGSVALGVLTGAELPLLISGRSLGLSSAGARPYRIVATTDGSPASRAALRAIASLGTTEGVEVTLLRVHEHEPADRGNAEALEACERDLAEARKLLPESLPVETVVRDIPRGAGVDTAILEKAQEVGAHAIAMSTLGHSARRHVVIGSVAMTTLGRSPLPLLLVRAEA